MTFPNSRQPQGSNACGPVSLQNVYEHLGLTKPLADILQELGITEKDYTNHPQLARNALKNKLLARLIVANPYTVSREWATLSREQLQEKLKAWLAANQQHDWRKDALHLLFFIQEGGEVQIADGIATSTIDKSLTDGFTIVVTCERSWLWGRRKLIGVDEYDDIRGVNGGHVVVIYGAEGDSYLVSDPISSKEGGLVKINKDTLLNATLIWNSQLLLLKKV